ncbi:AlpA family phage regulatory protein [Xanthobacter tagetidis]|uniref:AlpA family phage regulatory protein n=2 Tax=Xanthobacter tagetidis TaxID=60216 RepID=A0A3L7AD20_9HYPH|nr:AlpA family phage regulatory protein [Xanthobacter tagetidis]
MERRPGQRLLSLAEVCERTGRSRWWVRAAVLEGRFPAPVSTGSRSPRWVDSEIDGWIASLIAERDAQAGAAR